MEQNMHLNCEYCTFTSKTERELRTYSKEFNVTHSHLDYNEHSVLIFYSFVLITRGLDLAWTFLALTTTHSFSLVSFVGFWFGNSGFVTHLYFSFTAVSRVFLGSRVGQETMGERKEFILYQHKKNIFVWPSCKGRPIEKN